MKKLQEIKLVCDETVQDYEELTGKYDSKEAMFIDQGRSELAQQILEILNGEIK